MIADLIVVFATAFAVVLCVAWAARPDLRDWLERPKHGFRTRVERYDRSLP